MTTKIDETVDPEVVAAKGLMALTRLVGGIALIPAIMIYDGWVVSLLWNWFMPVFTSIRLSVPEAIGLGLLYVGFRGIRAPVYPDNPMKGVWLSLLVMTLSLGIGWIAHHYL